MRSIRGFGSLLLFAWLAASLCAQRTWTVDRWNRPGADFTDLPPAISAAADGDVIFLRATSGLTTNADAYSALTLAGKGVIIVGESGTGVPPVYIKGVNSITGVPATSVALLSNVNFWWIDGWGMWITLSNNPGAVVFRGVAFTGFSLFGPTLWSNCGLIVLEGCALYLRECRFELLQSKVMMSNTLLTKQGAQVATGQPGVWVNNCEVHANACTFIGASASASEPFSCSEAMALMNGSTLHLSGGTYLQGGSYGGGGCPDLTGYIGTNYSNIDLSTVFAHGFIPDATHRYTSRTGISTSTTSNTISIDQYQPPLTLTFLAMAPLTTSPWTNILGPVYLDPNLVWTDLALAPSSGTLRRSFVIPPTIPRGQWVGVQAFALHPQTLAVLNSNATVVGVW